MEVLVDGKERSREKIRHIPCDRVRAGTHVMEYSYLPEGLSRAADLGGATCPASLVSAAETGSPNREDLEYEQDAEA